MEQIITEDGEVVESLATSFEKTGVCELGNSYHTVAIIGAQSSGKSTLLNLLFETKFETMNETIGRQQTTKGIHASLAQKHPILIFDVEGCDSRERGDSNSLFERKASLFALALSEVLIINMWESDIGRYNASNIPMLRTVFEVNVQLFLAQSQTRTTLFFIIRDFTTNAFDEICSQIKADMDGIWKDIQLPPQLEGKTIDDFFDFKFFATHHMLLERSKFDDDINNLRQRFIDPSSNEYLFTEFDKMNHSKEN